MTREADWLESEAHDAFPDDAEFTAGNQSGHVIVRWTVAVGGNPRRNAPLVVVLESAVIDRWGASNEGEQDRISRRVREIIRSRLRDYDATGPLDVPLAFPIYLEEGAL